MAKVSETYISGIWIRVFVYFDRKNKQMFDKILKER